MTTNQPGRWAKVWRWARRILLIVAAAVLVFLLITILVFDWPMESGFGSYTPPKPPIEGYQREKTLWDLLQLLIIPLGLASVGFFFNRAQQMSAEKAATQRDDTERKITEQRTQDAALDTYLGQIADLLLHKQLLTTQANAEVRDIAEELRTEQAREATRDIAEELRTEQAREAARDVAQVRTLTALRRLDGDRNQILIQFLRDAGLLVGDTPIISLSAANLRGVNLRGVSLQGANLQGADLRDADLRGTILEGANLEGATMPDGSIHE